MATAKVFKSGNSQAVRLPKEFRLRGKEVEIFRRGDELVLREKSKGLERAFEIIANLPIEDLADERCGRTGSAAAGAGRSVTAPKYLLDTDTFVYIRRGRPQLARDRFRTLRPGEAILSIISHGELLYGIKKKRVGENPLRDLEELINFIEVVTLPPSAAEIYGDIRATLSLKGEEIGSNDLWIAAHAITSNLILVTNNEREFRRVPDLKIENWIA
jgi:tRNA(fMet)-specific endonuclease VapC